MRAWMPGWPRGIPIAVAIGAAALVMAVIATLSRGSISGEVFDANSGLPVAGVELIHGDHVQHLFASSRFAFGQRANAPLLASAPGYEDIELPPDALGSRTVSLAMTPVAIPGLTGMVVWARHTDAELILDVQLRGEDGRAMSLFPAVELPGHLVLARDPDAGDREPAIVFDGAVTPTIDPSATHDKLKYRIPLSDLEVADWTGSFSIDLSVSAPDTTLRWQRSGLTITQGGP